MSKPVTIIWFRQDLRLYDNPALVAAAKTGTVLPIFILDTTTSADFKLGSASAVWLHHSLESLNKDLKQHLQIFNGDPLTILLQLAKKIPNVEVFWNRCYEPWQITRDKKIKTSLQKEGLKITSFNGSLLWEPWEVLKNDGTPYKVFTPYYRNGCLRASPPRRPLDKPKCRFYKDSLSKLTVQDLGLLPKIRWDQSLSSQWTMGEKAAQNRLNNFIQERLSQYKEGRNFPAKEKVSRLSPHLHWGEISPNQIWYDVVNTGNDENHDCLLSELGWREFSYYLLYHFPFMPFKNLQAKFDAFPWKKNNRLLEAWKRGQTGYPIVDAGMRELWQTGYIHNRVRMIVASFLVKNLLQHWNEGQTWFWDCLVDADLASNSASWQWVAGSGADAAPYFRIFNPITQGEKFDPDGLYTRRFVPELSHLPNKYLYKPWQAPDNFLASAGIELGKTYPHPIVDVKASRELALEAYNQIKGLTKS